VAERLSASEGFDSLSVLMCNECTVVALSGWWHREYADCNVGPSNFNSVAIFKTKRLSIGACRYK
jgi:hypothetical protein